jgi:hypothetical protein
VEEEGGRFVDSTSKKCLEVGKRNVQHHHCARAAKHTEVKKAGGGGGVKGGGVCKVDGVRSTIHTQAVSVSARSSFPCHGRAASRWTKVDEGEEQRMVLSLLQTNPTCLQGS